MATNPENLAPSPEARAALTKLLNTKSTHAPTIRMYLNEMGDLSLFPEENLRAARLKVGQVGRAVSDDGKMAIPFRGMYAQLNKAVKAKANIQPKKTAIQKLLDTQGLNPEYVLRLMREALNQARKGDLPVEMINALCNRASELQETVMNGANYEMASEKIQNRFQRGMDEISQSFAQLAHPYDRLLAVIREENWRPDVLVDIVRQVQKEGVPAGAKEEDLREIGEFLSSFHSSLGEPEGQEMLKAARWFADVEMARNPDMAPALTTHAPAQGAILLGVYKALDMLVRQQVEIPSKPLLLGVTEKTHIPAISEPTPAEPSPELPTIIHLPHNPATAPEPDSPAAEAVATSQTAYSQIWEGVNSGTLGFQGILDLTAILKEEGFPKGTLIPHLGRIISYIDSVIRGISERSKSGNKISMEYATKQIRELEQAQKFFNWKIASLREEAQHRQGREEAKEAEQSDKKESVGRSAEDDSGSPIPKAVYDATQANYTPPPYLTLIDGDRKPQHIDLYNTALEMQLAGQDSTDTRKGFIGLAQRFIQGEFNNKNQVHTSGLINALKSLNAYLADSKIKNYDKINIGGLAGALNRVALPQKSLNPFKKKPTEAHLNHIKDCLAETSKLAKKLQCRDNDAITVACQNVSERIDVALSPLHVRMWKKAVLYFGPSKKTSAETLEIAARASKRTNSIAAERSTTSSPNANKTAPKDTRILPPDSTNAVHAIAEETCSIGNGLTGHC